jgi:hypothetical protein
MLLTQLRTNKNNWNIRGKSTQFGHPLQDKTKQLDMNNRIIDKNFEVCECYAMMINDLFSKQD